MSFEKLGLSTEILRAVADQGYTEPTPIQNKAIPVVLKKHDIMACAQTGTGKTAGFVLPMLQLMNGRPIGKGRRPLRGLILTPTRELAAQVDQSIVTYSKYLSLRSTVIFGGVKISPQIRALRAGIDILVATPGRLLDHLSQGTIDLSKIEFLVLDEADRMLDMGFIHDIKKVLAALPSKRQNLLFSATFSNEIRDLATRLLDNPVSVEVAPRNTTAERVTQIVHPVDRMQKRQLVFHIISEGNWRQVLVFARTKHGADRLARQLERDGISSTAIHGNKSQGARTKALARFKNGGIRVLVATDIAARGLDIDKLPHVINYELPNVPEDYVHRIGRTGRAGCEGGARSLVSAEEHKLLRNIERLLKTSIPQEIIEGFEPKETSQEPSLPERSLRSVAPQQANPRSRPKRKRKRAAGPARPSNQVQSSKGERNEKTENNRRSSLSRKRRSSTRDKKPQRPIFSEI